MFFHRDLKGNHLPRGTVCLTFDDGPGETDGDGPGPRTSEVGRVLFEHGVPGTFFLIGRHAEEYPATVERLVAWGHLVGNHTFTHPGLVAVATSGGDVVGELEATDRLLRAVVPAGPLLFRAPYGNWRERDDDGANDRPVSIVAERLNRSPSLRATVGPVNWDISNQDWTYWERGRPGIECAASCLEKIERVGSGIVLLHDSSEDPAARRNNRMVDVVQHLVPELRRRGYRFVRLDAVPQVASALRVAALVALVAADGRFLGAFDDGAVRAGGSTLGVFEPLGVAPLGGRRVALRASDGRYLSAPAEAGDDDAVRSEALAIGPRETFEWTPIAPGRVALRVADGRALRCDPADGRLVVAGNRTGDAGTFAVRTLVPEGEDWHPGPDSGEIDPGRGARAYEEPPPSSL